MPTMTGHHNFRVTWPFDSVAIGFLYTRDQFHYDQYRFPRIDSTNESKS